MTRADALRNRLPATLRPFTRGAWPFVWVGVAAVAAWWTIGGATFQEASAARDRVATERRLVRAMRDAAASEDAERLRAASLFRWLDEAGPARVVAPSVQIGIARLQERIQALVAGVGEGVALLPGNAAAAQVETLIESTPDGRAFHLVRVELQVRAETMSQMSRVIAAVESGGELWLRPGNSTLTTYRGAQGQAPRWNVSQVWALLEVRPEKT